MRQISREQPEPDANHGVEHGHHRFVKHVKRIEKRLERGDPTQATMSRRTFNKACFAGAAVMAGVDINASNYSMYDNGGNRLVVSNGDAPIKDQIGVAIQGFGVVSSYAIAQANLEATKHLIPWCSLRWNNLHGVSNKQMSGLLGDVEKSRKPRLTHFKLDSTGAPLGINAALEAGVQKIGMLILDCPIFDLSDGRYNLGARIAQSTLIPGQIRDSGPAATLELAGADIGDYGVHNGVWSMLGNLPALLFDEPHLLGREGSGMLRKSYLNDLAEIDLNEIGPDLSRRRIIDPAYTKVIIVKTLDPNADIVANTVQSTEKYTEFFGHNFGIKPQIVNTSHSYHDDWALTAQILGPRMVFNIREYESIEPAQFI